MITLNQLSLSQGTKTLLHQASVSLFEKQKIGLVGHNGCGKSTLFSLLLGKIAPDAGDFQMNRHLRISHLAQELPDSSDTALAFVLSGDEEYTSLQEKIVKAESSGDDAELLACHHRLGEIGGYGKPAQAASILSGLGFTIQQQEMPVNSFSGGWQMRLNLARCLMSPADLYLLDEPTNHLDMEAIFWLERWLNQSPASILLISHDRDFLDGFVTHILHIEHQKLNLYTGNYSRFELVRAEKLALQQATYEKQQKKIEHLMSYVDRFRAKASKARQAQSRLKAIDRMEIVAKAQIDSPFSFEFYPCPKVSKTLLTCEDLRIGYGPQRVILKDINLTINPGDRLALLGPNGAGKSTLIKALTNSLHPLSGQLDYSKHIRMGYFAQHQLDDLDLNLSPVQTILSLTPQAKEQEVRDFLGGFNFRGDMALDPIEYFSGGEKARLALAKLVWLKPNLILLDEPTNHLDLGMRSALEIALQQYEGAMILISHDRHLLRTVVDEFYLVFGQKLTKFDGDIEAYHEWLLNRCEEIPDKNSSTAAVNHKERKNFKNKLQKLEKQIDELQNELKQIDARLADPVNYEPKNVYKIHQLNENRDILLAQLKMAESDWLALAEMLESQAQ